LIELNGESYLNGQEASSFLGVKVSTLYAYVSRGIIKSYQQGIKRQRLYKQTELEALLLLRSSTDQVDSAPVQATELPYASDWMSDV
jgi:citrate synthase